MNIRGFTTLLCALALLPGLCACSRTTTRGDHPLRARGVEVLPGVHVQGNRVHFMGMVAEQYHDPETPLVYLELVVCKQGTRDHESLVSTTVPARDIHAALLVAGARPGAPGTVEQTQAGKVRVTQPTGSPIAVTFAYADPDGNARTVGPGDWITNEKDPDRGTLSETLGPMRFVFAGSREGSQGGNTYYMADYDGSIVGLATFGSECVAWDRVFSPWAAVHEPVWVGKNESIPSFRAPVLVTLEVLDGSP